LYELEEKKMMLYRDWQMQFVVLHDQDLREMRKSKHYLKKRFKKSLSKKSGHKKTPNEGGTD